MEKTADLENRLLSLLTPGRIVTLGKSIGIISGCFIAPTRADSFIQIAWDSERDNLWELSSHDRIGLSQLYARLKSGAPDEFQITDVVLSFHECMETLSVLGFFSENQEKRKKIVGNIRKRIA